MSEKIFKCPNDMNVTVKKDSGEFVLDESCCTAMVILLKNDGNMATSFYGYHNEKLFKIMSKAQKKYFRSLKKRLKTESIEDNIEVKSEEIPEDKKWKEDNISTNEKKTKKTNESKEDELSTSGDKLDKKIEKKPTTQKSSNTSKTTKNKKTTK